MKFVAVPVLHLLELEEHSIMFQIRIQAIDSKQLGTLLFKPFAAHLKMKFGVPFYFLVSELEIEF